MTNWIPPTLSKVLGSSLDAIDQEAITRLIGYPETGSIDFKRQLQPMTDKGRRDLSLDIIQFVNSTGGLIIFGIEETDGVATRIVPMPPDKDRSERAHWIDQVAVGNIVPQATIGCYSVHVDDGEVLVVSVPPSIAAPHAVKVNEGLRYVVRAGREKRSLAEHEVAERYRSRFDAFADSREIGEELHARALQSPRHHPVNIDENADLRVVVSAVPDQRGHIPMRRGLADEWERDVLSELFDFPTYDRNDSLRLSPRYRSMSLESRDPFMVSTVAELNLDGTASIGQSLSSTVYQPNASIFARASGPALGPVASVRDDYLVADLVNIVNVLCRHALRCEAQGALVITASLHTDHPDVKQLALVTQGSLLHGSVRALNPTRPVHRSIFPDAVVRDPLTLLESVRLVAGDLLSHFGIPEPHQFNDAGEFQADHYDIHLSEAIRTWLQSH